MSTPFLGQINMTAINFASRGHAFCSGQLLPISQNSALFSLLGTIYGGDGQNTFALPDLRGRIPVNQGQGPGLSNYIIGSKAGTEMVTLTSNQMPQHSHVPVGKTSSAGAVPSPTGNTWSANGTSVSSQFAVDTTTPKVSMAPSQVGLAGGNQPHNNVPPFLVINFVIALEGIYPSRN